MAAVGGVAALVRTGGYAIDPATSAKLAALAPWQYVVVRAVARRVVAPDRAEAPLADDVGIVEFVDGYLVDVRAAERRDFVAFVRFLEHVAPLASGFWRRFSELSSFDQDAVLASLESSSSDTLRAGFQALRALVLMGYYRDPRTFGILGYRGPLLSPGEGAP